MQIQKHVSLYTILHPTWKMSKQAKLEMNSDVLNVVDSWLGGNNDEKVESKQPVFEKRPQRLGLGAKYVPHKKV